MKKLPEVDLSFEHFYRMLIAPIRSKLLLAGIELKVFNQLSEPRSAEDVAEAIGTHPEMKGVVFDKQAIVKVAETFIKEYEMEDRMEVLAGDYSRDPIGKEYDLIWASGTLNSVKDNMASLLKKIYDALNLGGVFISFHDGLTHERTRPEIMALAWLSTAVMGNDCGFDQGFVADSMLRVGFKSVRSRTLNTPMGPMDLDIGRKAKYE